MIENFLRVSEHVLVLFILIAIGFAAKKTKIIGESSVKGMTKLVLYFVTPCVMINAFHNSEFNNEMLVNLILTMVAVLLTYAGSIAVATLIFRDKNESRRAVLRFATIFSNCGFMSLPLQEAILGDDGVFYGSICVAMFNLVSWTYGLVIMSGTRKSISAKKLLTNPGIIGVTLAIIIWVTNIHLPDMVHSPITYMAGLNTPIPMIIIGSHLASANIKKALTDKWCYVSMALRMLVIPAATMFGLLACGIGGSMMVAIVIATSAPVAATTTMFATTYDRDTELSVSLVSVTTVISILTMPSIVALAQFFA